MVAFLFLISHKQVVVGAWMPVCRPNVVKKCKKIKNISIFSIDSVKILTYASLLFANICFLLDFSAT